MDELNKLEEIESEFKQNKKIKKIIGIFLFLLIISYFLLYYGLPECFNFNALI